MKKIKFKAAHLANAINKLRYDFFGWNSIKPGMGSIVDVYLSENGDERFGHTLCVSYMIGEEKKVIEIFSSDLESDPTVTSTVRRVIFD